MTQFRILSLDGGGSWALIQVKALMKIYGAETTGRDVLRDFDLVVANSGGTITLGSLILDLPLSQVLEFFRDPAKRGQIFVPARLPKDLFAHITRFVAGIGPKYLTPAKLR